MHWIFTLLLSLGGLLRLRQKQSVLFSQKTRVSILCFLTWTRTGCNAGESRALQNSFLRVALRHESPRPSLAPPNSFRMRTPIRQHRMQSCASAVGKQARLNITVVAGAQTAVAFRSPQTQPAHHQKKSVMLCGAEDNPSFLARLSLGGVLGATREGTWLGGLWWWRMNVSQLHSPNCNMAACLVCRRTTSNGRLSGCRGSPLGRLLPQQNLKPAVQKGSRRRSAQAFCTDQLNGEYWTRR